MTAACALILAATLSTIGEHPGRSIAAQTSPGPIAAAIATAPALDVAVETWMLDRKVGRPAAVKIMYGSLAALQALDVYSTYRSLDSGAAEVNPIVKKAVGNQAAMIAVKAMSTAGSTYFAERAWKKNRKGAVVLMAIVNGVTAAVVARNLNNAR